MRSVLAPGARRALALGAVAAAGLAAAPWALGIDVPGAPGSDVTSPTRALTAGVQWAPAPPVDPLNTVVYEGGLGDAVDPLGAEPATVLVLPEGESSFRVRAVELAPDGTRIAESDFSAGLILVADRTAPTIRPAAPPPSTGAWARGPVTVSFDCGDGGTGVARCESVTLTEDGRDLPATGLAVDAVGNESTVTVRGYNIDATPPSRPNAVGPGEITNLPRPTLSWQAADDATSGLARYVVTLDGEPIGDAEASALSRRVPAALEDGVHEWSIRAVDVAGNPGPPSATSTFVVDTSVPAAPVIDGPPALIAERSPEITWSGLPAARLDWSLSRLSVVTNAPPVPVRVGGGTTTAPRLPVSGLADGDYRLEAVQVNRAGTSGAAAALGFTVDTAAPEPPVFTSRPASPGDDPRPVLRWRGEAGGAYQWQLLDRDGGSMQGPVRSTDGEVRLASLPPGSYLFRVRQTDPAGNVGEYAQAGFTVVRASEAGSPGAPAATGGGATGAPGGAASPAPAPRLRVTRVGGTTVLRPPTQQARRLTPRAGVGLRSLRPRLSWRARPRGTTLLNVQIFRMRGRALVKVHSAFPRGRTYQVPGGVLKRGHTYVWRVWPYLGRRGFSDQPIGVSWFRTRTGSRT